MPQMMPMMWMPLHMLILSLYMILLIKIFFTPMIIIKSSPIPSLTFKCHMSAKWNWKW